MTQNERKPAGKGTVRDASRMQSNLQLRARKQQTDKEQCWNASNHDNKNASEQTARTFAAKVVRLQVGKKEENTK